MGKWLRHAPCTRVTRDVVTAMANGKGGRVQMAHDRLGRYSFVVCCAGERTIHRTARSQFYKYTQPLAPSSMHVASHRSCRCHKKSVTRFADQGRPVEKMRLMNVRGPLETASARQGTLTCCSTAPVQGSTVRGVRNGLCYSVM